MTDIIDFELVTIAAALSDAKPKNAEKVLALAMYYDATCDLTIDWDLVKTAGELSETNRNAAVQLMLTAVTCAAGQKCCGGGGGGEKEVKSSEEKAVVYGDGYYTDAQDPRKPNLRKHDGGNGQEYTAINGLVKVNPDSLYKCVSAEALFNDESCNLYVVVLNESGGMIPPFNARMITGGDGKAGTYDQLIDAPASPGSYFMGRDSKFDPKKAIGPIGAVVLNDDGKISSDWVYGLGLPAGEHVSFRISFAKRG